MDPIQAIAARQVSLSHSEAKDIDAFYDAHAFASLHEAKCAVIRLAKLLAAMCTKTGREASVGTEIASSPGRA